MMVYLMENLMIFPLYQVYPSDIILLFFVFYSIATNAIDMMKTVELGGKGALLGLRLGL